MPGPGRLLPRPPSPAVGARRGAAQALAAVGRMVAQEPDLAVVGQRIADTVREIFGASTARLLRLDPVSAALHTVAVSGDTEHAPSTFPAGSGVAGAAVRDRRAKATADFTTDLDVTYPPEIAARLRQSPNRAVLAVPVLLQGRIMGVLAIATPTGTRFAAEDVELGQAFADIAALALDNAHAYAQARRREREAEELARVARLLTGSLDVADVGRRTVEAAAPLLGAAFSRLWLRQPDGTLRVLAWAGGPAADDTRRSPPPGIGVAARALADGKPLWTSDALADPRFSHDAAGRRALADAGERAVLAVPLHAKGEAIGTLTIGDRAGRVFTEHDVALVQAFADQAALALDNARLHEAAMRRQEELRALLRAAHSVMAGLDLDTTLERIVEEARRITGSPHVKVVLTGSAAVGSGAERVAATGQPLFLPDVRADPLNPHADADGARGLVTWLGLPIVSGAEVLGVLSVNTTEPRTYGDAELTYLASFADQAAVAIVNARLHGEVVRRERELQSLYEALSRTQEQLTQSQKMEAIGRLAGGVAHDFNNLLTVITGRAYLVLSRLGDGTAKRHVELIAATADRATSLTRQLLAFSRKQVLQPRVVDLNEIVASMTAMLRRLIGEDIRLVTGLEPHLGVVRADPSQLEQVVMNLAVNARDAMPGGGTLAIETGNVDLAGERGLPPGPYVRLRVSDTGLGMDAETRARIFEPFFTTKERGQGTGLGLSTVYGIVQQSDGAVWVESDPGRGATFTVCLPRVNEPATPPAAGPAHPGRVGAETILLVEDEDDVRELAREILEHAGFAVLEAASGAEALAVLQAHRGPVHLLLTDVIMPQTSGPQVAAACLRARPGLAVLYMSGYTDDAIATRGLLDPGTEFLQKPFTPAALTLKIREILSARA